MKSFAIWIEQKEQHTSPSNDFYLREDICPVEVNFNYLTDCMYEKKRVPVLDFGVKYEYKEGMEYICVFVPFLITKDKISDLGRCLSQNKEILNSIFNENYTTHDVQQVSFCNVMEKESRLFSIYSLDVEHDLVLTGDYEGTIIKIKAKKPGEECAQKVYYRFRMQSEELQYLKCVYTPSNNIFSSSFERNGYIDFRFNDYRTLDAGLIERMQAEKNIPIIVEKFHFLLITKAQVQVTASEQYTERSLNKELWNNYYSEFDPHNLIVANHWHKKATGEGIKEVALLIKLKENVCTNITIGIYIIVLMIITVLFNILSNWIWSML